ncbi:MAG: hypothetical protein EXR77_17865 [Myxococcales bacterium]|nr:hypothetical protein [Myxococcales bacterium]
MSKILQKILGSLAGLALGVAVVLAVGHFSGERAVGAARVTPVAEFSGRLRLVWLQFSSDATEITGVAQSDFLAALRSDTQVLITLAGQQERAAFEQFLSNHKLTKLLHNRVRIVEVTGPVTPWTRDRALYLDGGAGGLRLLVPPAPDQAWQRRFNDWQAVATLRSAIKGAKVMELPLEFDGGDLALLTDEVVFGSNLVAKNRSRGFATAQDLARSLQVWTGRPALALGIHDGDVPRYHLAMYWAPTGRRTAIVGDPRLARAITGPRFAVGDLSVETGDLLVADDSTPTQAQFDRAAADLVRAGWAVERVPVVAFDERTYVTWTNAVAESDADHKIVYLPTYASASDGPDAPIRQLDALGAAAWQRAGFAVRPIRVAGVWRHHGTIGCLVAVLQRVVGPDGVTD